MERGGYFDVCGGDVGPLAAWGGWREIEVRWCIMLGVMNEYMDLVVGLGCVLLRRKFLLGSGVGSMPRGEGWKGFFLELERWGK